MAQIDLDHLDDRIRRLLVARAAEHGRTVEEEARAVLTSALHPGLSNGAPQAKLGSAIAARFRECPLDDALPECRGHQARPADFDSR